MLVQLLHGPRVLGKVLYAKGKNEIPDALMNDWFFKELLKSGDIALQAPEVKEEPKVEAKADADKPQAKKAK